MTTATKTKTTYRVFHHNGRFCSVDSRFDTREAAIEKCRELNQEIIDENGGHNDTGHYYTTDANDSPATA